MVSNLVFAVFFFFFYVGLVLMARVFYSGPSECDIIFFVFGFLQLFAIDRLESYLHEEGPVAPILITSQPGCGKSTLMAYW